MRIFLVKSACNSTATRCVKFDQSNSPLVLFCGVFALVFDLVFALVFNGRVIHGLP